MRDSTGMALMCIFIAIITANETLPEDSNARLITIGGLFALALVVLASDGIRDRLNPPHQTTPINSKSPWGEITACPSCDCHGMI